VWHTRTEDGGVTISLLRQKIDNLDLTIAEDKLKVIVKLSFSRTLKNLKKYLEVIEWLRDYMTYYAQKIESLQKRKTNLLKEDSVKRKSRKAFSLKILIKNSFSIEIDVYNQLQSDFNRAKWLTHYNRIRQLYADVDAFKKNFDVMIYYIKNDIKFKKNSSSKKEMKSIFFLSKTLSFAKSRY
jgi:hypothetical protein